MIPREGLIEMFELGIVNRETDQLEALQLWGRLHRWKFQQGLAGKETRVSNLSNAERIALRDQLLGITSMRAPAFETKRESVTKRLEDDDGFFV